jgi:hypothetical protein
MISPFSWNDLREARLAAFTTSTNGRTEILQTFQKFLSPVQEFCAVFGICFSLSDSNRCSRLFSVIAIAR